MFSLGLHINLRDDGKGGTIGTVGLRVWTPC